ncbi:hypothetical protein [Methyloceanibacter caenitepidi]|uniref:Uncharacterized protein n=1 Tax=Methyloceanibacter caenitepidi TaxID=1384459 RepID=A0A0A8K010_9HYPH|nr:hypothetical protein [Methyloceanibacter caenitepidi]BAQ16081.1 hypothetical protein GL4_0618 [Methyloceanibacter caenitepidi]
MMTKRGGLDPLLSDIEDALVAYGLSATRFGYLVAGDPTLVPKMRGGRRVRAALRQKIEAALARLSEEGVLA